jgi:hypothetical protein
MKDTKLAVLGGSFLQIDFVETALSLGIESHVIDGNPRCYMSQLKTIKFQPFDFSKQELLEEYCNKNEINFVYAPCNEVGNLISSRLASILGFNYNSEDVVNITLNKSLQRKKAATCKYLYSPKSILFRGNIQEVEEFINYPMVVKPTSSSAGRGITGVNNRKDLINALTTAEQYCQQNGQILVEEYIVGDQISIETVSVNGVHSIVGITKEIVGPKPLFIERSHYMNHGIHEKFLPIVENGVKELLDAIGIQYGPCHIEMKVEGNRVSLIEIASRAGGLRDRLMKLAGYSDFNKIILSAYLNNQVDHNDLHLPSKHSLVNILTKVDDLNCVPLGKRDNTLHSLYFNEKGPVYDPQNIMDAYGYAYFTSEKSLNTYSLENY